MYLHVPYVLRNIKYYIHALFFHKIKIYIFYWKLEIYNGYRYHNINRFTEVKIREMVVTRSWANRTTNKRDDVNQFLPFQ